GTVCVVGKIRDLILQLSKSSIYSTKPHQRAVLLIPLLIFAENIQAVIYAAHRLSSPAEY
ncbi:hypothetical protein N6H07_20375, partial [Enterobacter cloacae]|nr:hypothetical protein [Enterobacter cloacae]